MWFKSSHLHLLHHRFSSLCGLFLWSQRQVVNSPNKKPLLLIPFSSSATAKFLGPHYRKVFENLAPFLETTLLRVCIHHSIKAALDLAKVNCPSSGQFQSSFTCPLGSIELFFPSSIYFTCHLRTTPPASFTSSSLPHLLIPPLKKKMPS